MKKDTPKVNKELKAALRSEVSPLLIGLRNELKRIVAAQASDVKLHLTEDGLGIAVVKGAKGENGRDAVVDYEMILKKVEKMLPAGRRGRPGVKGKDGKNGKDGSTPIKGIHYRDGKDGEDGKTIIREKSMTGDEILARLEASGIPASMITGLEKLIKKLTAELRPWQPGGFGAAGTTNVATSFYVETPVGAINGVNTVYTVSARITAIISLTINGQFIHPSEYAFSDRTITFNTPLDASLSGLPFTIVYV